MEKSSRKEFFTTRNIAGLSFLSALTVILQILGNFINFGFASINLSLVPIAVGALLYGPIGGLLLGILNGLVVAFSPSTIAVFYPLTIPGTIVVCLLKTGIAGMSAGFIFNCFKNKGTKKELIGAIIACVSVPIINTLLFSVGFMLFFTQMASDNGSDNAFLFLIVSVIGINFIFELLANSLLSHAAYTIYRYFVKRNARRMDVEEVNVDNEKL